MLGQRYNVNVFSHRQPKWDHLVSPKAKRSNYRKHLTYSIIAPPRKSFGKESIPLYQVGNYDQFDNQKKYATSITKKRPKRLQDLDIETLKNSWENVDIRRGRKSRLARESWDRKRNSLHFSLDRPPTPQADGVYAKPFIKPFYSPKVKLRTLQQKIGFQTEDKSPQVPTPVMTPLPEQQEMMYSSFPTLRLSPTPPPEDFPAQIEQQLTTSKVNPMKIFSQPELDRFTPTPVQHISEFHHIHRRVSWDPPSLSTPGSPHRRRNDAILVPLPMEAQQTLQPIRKLVMSSFDDSDGLGPWADPLSSKYSTRNNMRFN